MLARLRGGLLGEWLALWGIALALVAAATAWAPFARLDNVLHDALLRAAPARPSPDILIVAIDDRSVHALGRWPWPRAVHADLLGILEKAGPRVIGYDVLFVEPERGTPGDEWLARALAAAAPVVVPYLVEVPGEGSAASRIVLPAGPLARAAHLGHAIVKADADGVVRALPRLEADGQPLAHLADVVAELARTGRPPSAIVPASGAVIGVRPALRIRFREGPAGYPQVSFSDVLAGRVPPEFLRDRIVLVGATAAGLGDRHATPMSGRLETMPGVEVLANHVDSTLAGDRIRLPPAWAQFLFTALPLSLLMLGLLRFGPRVNLWLGLLWAAVTLAASALLLWLGRVWFAPATALVGLALIYPLWGWRRLDFANRFMGAELEALASEPAILPRRHPPPPVGDPVARQVALMHAAIQDVRDLRRFVGESLDSLPDATLVTDLEGRILIANDAAVDLFHGRLAGPLLGLGLEPALQALAGDEPELMREARDLLDAIARGDRATRSTREWRLADGTDLDVRLAFFSDDAGRPLGWILRFVDITPLREAERQREEALRLLTHDMRSPQASILAILEAEGAGLPDGLRDRIARYASQTLALADQYVQFARAALTRPVLEPFDLNEAALDAADDLWPLARARGNRISTTVPDGEALVLGDRALVTRAIQNLLGNAIKYGRRGTAVALAVTRAGDDWCLAVHDEGPGIPPAQLPSLFEPFRRLAAPEGRPPEPGAGLGLAFVKRVVERHGGQVFATSTPGRGSTFGFRLPAAPPRPDQAADATPAAAARARAAS
ncbi:MAG: CHASE2 domain-containing protein [Sphingomonadaceae bacterium]|uniref:CHASE2 domain-containing protein n=1 Tax=Thermaurantiacus sp. TaxID=2820283 RepID=UPI00298EEE13|nr:CHASE2 domain-containing protein [Thermaurantiacus sp.]MCS6986580.1 CHASE2 domain-containing protein [Sphingomonadaceae bacterium]MDW8414159.1 CHASE2 domain-containing protein [Thermaurantiacus sp.]